MRAKISKIILALVLISAFSCPVGFRKNSFGVLPNFLILAQEEGNLDPIEERQQLEEELKKLESELLKIEEDITKTEKEKKTLQNQIYILKQKIAKLNLQIQQSNTMIKDLGFQIEDTEKSINQTSLKIEDSRQKLADILQAIYQEDQKSLIEILISERTLSGFFDNLIALETLNLKSRELLENIKNLKSSLEVQEQSLDEEKTDLEKVVIIQTLQKKESESVKKDQDYLLKLTETQYQKQLKEKEETAKKAAEIRARIFELIGVPKAPTFGEALEIAKYVESITGVKSALVLAVLTQESNIGRNVGQCVLTNSSTGAGKRISTGAAEIKVMSPSRDIPFFLKITGDLGRDPYNTPVSCRIPSVGGYGGAMGPAQFIPDTWANPKYGYGLKVTEITGKPADPWNVKDAFLAAGLYLRDSGASQDEFKAVMRYFSGNSWTKYEEFYGRSVLAIKAGYEQDIKELENGG